MLPQSQAHCHRTYLRPFVAMRGSPLLRTVSIPYLLPVRSIILPINNHFLYLQHIETLLSVGSMSPLSFDKEETISSPTKGAYHFDCACSLLPFGIVVEHSPVRSFAADCPLYRHLGFNLMPSLYFFLLSQPSHQTMFHVNAVAYRALGFSSN